MYVLAFPEHARTLGEAVFLLHTVFGGSGGKSVRLSRYISPAGSRVLETTVNACEIRAFAARGYCVFVHLLHVPVLGALRYAVCVS